MVDLASAIARSVHARLRKQAALLCFDDSRACSEAVRAMTVWPTAAQQGDTVSERPFTSGRINRSDEDRPRRSCRSRTNSFLNQKDAGSQGLIWAGCSQHTITAPITKLMTQPSGYEARTHISFGVRQSDE